MTALETLEVVEALATALDEDDYETVGSLLSPDVVYEIGDETLTGPEAVIHSYRSSSEMARTLFDSVEYAHEHPIEVDQGVFEISYLDVLGANGDSLVHHAKQVVSVEASSGVVHIRNIDVPGEKERMDEFLQRHGLSRDMASET